MKTIRQNSYRVSERVLLEDGDQFRAKGGPQWRLSDGTKVSLSAKGPFRFRGYCKRGTCEWIEATDKNGNFAILHIRGRRRRVDPAIINRPYVITGKKRKPKPKSDVAQSKSRR